MTRNSVANNYIDENGNIVRGTEPRKWDSRDEAYFYELLQMGLGDRMERGKGPMVPRIVDGEEVPF